MSLSLEEVRKVAKLARLDLPAADLAALQTQLSSILDYIDQLHKIVCPTLVLAGAHDWICPPDHSRLIAEKIPRAHLKVFAESSHSIPVDEPEAFLAAVRGFLTYAPL